MVKTKICGITRIEDAQLAENLGAWAVGFIFYPLSPRYVTTEKACEISESLKQCTKKVGVFVNEKPETINKIAEIVGLDYAQLHGHEPIEDCNKLTIPFIKTVRTVEETEIYSTAFAFLVDTIDTKNWGGTGKLADWGFAKSITSATGKNPVILSGGLSSDNIKEALRVINPNFIDVSSSIETAPGIKNHSAMSEFFKEIIND